MAEAEWRFVSEAFYEDQEAIKVYTTTADSRSDLAEELLLDPLPQLVENIPEVGSDWSVSLERVNGEVGVGRLKPPKKILFTWTVIASMSRVHGVLYRLPPNGAAA